MADGGETGSDGPVLIEDGDWAGWRSWRGSDPFEDVAGPFFFREEADGQIRCAFRAEARHMNGGGFMHGGAMLTFADFSLFAIAWRALNGEPAVTISLNADFTSSARAGDLVEAAGEVVRAGGSLIFVRGLISTGGVAMAPYSGVIKRMKRARSGA